LVGRRSSKREGANEASCAILCVYIHWNVVRATSRQIIPLVYFVGGEFFVMIDRILFHTHHLNGTVLGYQTALIFVGVLVCVGVWFA
jgi:hypothetical protein